MSHRASELAARLEHGANALVKLAEGLSDTDWMKPLPTDGRPIGIVIHHVASVYPLEVQVAQKIAQGEAITGVTMDAIAQMNAGHAKDHASVSKADTITLLKKNSKDAAEAIRAFTDAQLDAASPNSLYADAPLTAQFFIEDHALRHSYHHRTRIEAALGR